MPPLSTGRSCHTVPGSVLYQRQKLAIHTVHHSLLQEAVLSSLCRPCSGSFTNRNSNKTLRLRRLTCLALPQQNRKGRTSPAAAAAQCRRSQAAAGGPPRCLRAALVPQQTTHPGPPAQKRGHPSPKLQHISSKHLQLQWSRLTACLLWRVQQRFVSG